MPSIAVLGLGNWGTALANHLAVKGMDVLGWSVEPDIVSSINSRQQNFRYLPEIALNERLRATSAIQECLTAEVIVLAVPSKAMGEVIPLLKVPASTILVSAVKGLEANSISTPLQFAERNLPVKCKLVVLSGPSFARDVVIQKPCGLVSASSDEEAARIVAELFTSNTMKVYISGDPLGVELGGIVKNVIALAVGMSDGLGLGDSARAGLITRGLAEIMRLAEAMGADIRTLSGLSGLGDLAMTATSDLSRNRTVGLRLGKGEKLDQIVSSLGSVAEGVSTTPLVMHLAKKYNVDMPITAHVAQLIAGNMTPAEAVRGLISRPMKREID